ncbi:MAG: hypothetical protein K6B46_06420 [Opitutales bacterium]|nr:hypothetical protein [Opitutales bacterium]
MDDYKNKRLFEIKKLAGTGDPEAIYELALRYRDGRGGAFEDIETAEKFFRQAAEQNHVPAQIALAEIVETYDEEEAAEWRKKSNGVPAKKIFLFLVPVLLVLLLLLAFYF